VWGPLLLVPGLAILILVVGYPCVQGIRWSFTDFYLLNGLTGWTSVGLANYAKFLHDPEAAAYLERTAVWVVASLACQFSIGLTLALLLNRPLRLRAVYRAVALVPWVTPPVVAALIWRWIFHEQWGIVNATLMGAHLTTQPVRWLSDPTLVWVSLLVMSTWRFSPFWYVNILAGLQTIPREMYDAASVDGAGSVAKLWHITLPFLRPVLSVLFLLETIWRANEFGTIWVMTEGGPGKATTTLAILIYQTSFQFYRIGYAASIAVTLTVLLSVFALLYLRRAQMGQ